ncbi:TPA: YhbP family protein [Escherichia coli]
MEILMAISRWLKKQHVLTWCVQQKGELWCANAFYLFDADKVAFYLLTEEKTRHAQMSGPKAHVAGTVNGQPQTIALIRGVQFKGLIRLLEDEESHLIRQIYNRRFPIARMLSTPVWEIRIDEIKFTDNTLGFGKKLVWQRPITEQQGI